MSSTAPMSDQLPKSYLPADHESVILQKWEDSGLQHADADDDRPTYCILIPPPNVTAALHLGHAFNSTLQDILIRANRMRGANTLWMPGTDHAGIATQTVVEKRLMAQGKRRLDFTRDEFVARVREWKDEYQATITGQLKEMGASCDWQRQRFTMDDICAGAVREAFFRLFRDDLIYRGKRLVNWDPVTLTALADDEVEMQEIDGHFWYLKYPIVDESGADTGDFVTVATTRPETMLGDTAVAVNPNDSARAALIGKKVRVPIADRIIPIIGDDYVVIPDATSKDVKAQYASGFLKVTPAHDPNDWEIGLRHELPAINVMAPDASISDAHGWDDVSDHAREFVGLSREDARAKIVEWFKSHDLLEKIRDYTHSVGHSYRSHVPVEPYLSDQWYVRVSDDRLVGEAQRALTSEQYDGTPPARESGPATCAGDGELHFFPARYAHSYQAWHDNLRDWCISRQLWWGHRIPIWHRTIADGAETARVAETWNAIATNDPDTVSFRNESTPDGALLQLCFGRESDGVSEAIASAENDGFVQDEDVLDTWFSSALWPLNTMGWPNPEQDPQTAGLLERFNPTNILCTGRDIITLWVSRMVMFNRYFHHHTIPFRHVYIHPMIQDGHGQRMSKSLGNGVDPRDIIHSHGADALRFTLTQMATTTQDVRLPVDMVSPFSDRTMTPKETVSPAGYCVAAPVQICPETGKEFVSGYGVASGAEFPTDERPLARNTSAKFDVGRNFSNKVWNATRFALTHLADGIASTDMDPASRPLIDRWILHRLHVAISGVNSAVDQYQFNTCAETLYDFIWRDFCDWYLEAIKPTVRDDADQRQVLRTIIDTMLRLLHPVCPFVTEALWPAVSATGAAGVRGFPLPASELLASAAWPTADSALADPEAEADFNRVRELVNAIRARRAEHQVPPRREITLLAPPEVQAIIESCGNVVATLAGLGAIEPRPETRPTGAVTVTLAGTEVFLTGLVESVDLDAERARLEKLISEKSGAITGFKKKLENPGYVNNAPPPVVEQTRGMLVDAERDLEAARHALNDLP